MCGIAGACWSGGGPRVAANVVERMTDVLIHRGPNDQGVYESPSGNAGGAVLGFRRLSIIDLATGHQPLANERRDVWIVFNGEIYNYRELRKELEQRGHQFATQSDTEVIVHLYEEEGAECVQKLRGMFALAIWDEKAGRLVIARDRIGKKPLFYRIDQGRLWFASELKSLLQVPDAPRELNPRAVEQFLTYLYVPHPGCILQGYAKLPPAHYGVFEQGRLQLVRYWRPPYSGSVRSPALTVPSYGETAHWLDDRWLRELRERLTEAVRLRMRSDVPIGAFLSGGVDSTIIAGLMQQSSERPVHTFSIGFSEEKFDERKYAREAAKHLRTEHHEYVVRPSALEILPKLIWYYDEPFADSSAIPTMYLCEVTRQHVTVALSGDGGDELFAGYERYQAVRMAGMIDQLPSPVKKFLSSPVWQKVPASVEQKSLRRRIKRFSAALAQPPERRYLRWVGAFDEHRRAELLTEEFRGQYAGFDSSDFLVQAFEECGDRDFVTRTTCTDLLTYLPCDILPKVDIASMAFSLECRSPFLDHHVVELASRMPMHLKLKGRKGKRILHETFSDLLPEMIRNRAKMGFGVPLDHWFRRELRPLLHEVLLDSRSLGRGIFRPQVLQQLIEEHEKMIWDHSYRLWALLCFECWCRTFLDPVAAPSGPGF